MDKRASISTTSRKIKLFKLQKCIDMFASYKL